MNEAEFDALVREGVPMIGALGTETLKLAPEETIIRLPTDNPHMIRPGGTVTGPVMFALADIALYGLVLATVGRVELAVTTDMTIHFLRKPKPGTLICRATPLKAGQRLFIADCTLAPEGEKDPVAHVVGTYSIPPKR